MASDPRPIVHIEKGSLLMLKLLGALRARPILEGGAVYYRRAVNEDG